MFKKYIFLFLYKLRPFRALFQFFQVDRRMLPQKTNTDYDKDAVYIYIYITYYAIV